MYGFDAMALAGPQGRGHDNNTVAWLRSDGGTPYSSAALRPDAQRHAMQTFGTQK